MLEKESAGPSVNEFVEVLQKFKLAFITLVKSFVYFHNSRYNYGMLVEK
jgi:hypothetical protein